MNETSHFGGWALVPVEGFRTHAIPIGDSKEHFDENCPCNPTVDFECGNLMIHNSFDGREDFENGVRKPS